jgi:hypothetical protein
MGRRYAAGPPNGTCKNCRREAKSLDADYCSKRCRDEHQAERARADHDREMAQEMQDDDGA